MARVRRGCPHSRLPFRECAHLHADARPGGAPADPVARARRVRTARPDPLYARGVHRPPPGRLERCRRLGTVREFPGRGQSPGGDHGARGQAGHAQQGAGQHRDGPRSHGGIIFGISTGSASRTGSRIQPVTSACSSRTGSRSPRSSSSSGSPSHGAGASCSWSISAGSPRRKRTHASSLSP